MILIPSVSTGAIVISTTISLALGVYNIKRLQIEQHRAWMMRAWVYFASSITIRVIQEAAVVILTSMCGPPPSFSLSFH